MHTIGSKSLSLLKIDIFASKMSRRSKSSLRRSLNPGGEIRIQMNPLSKVESALLIRPKLCSSKWIIVRQNLRLIPILDRVLNSKSDKDESRDLCLLIHMRRQLRRKKELIRELEHEPNLTPIRHYHIRTDATHIEHYNVSKVKPTSVLYHPSFDEEPVVLQALFFYFHHECDGSSQSIFRPFMTEICSVIKRDRKRRKRADKLRQLAFMLSLFIFIILGLMFIALVTSVISTRLEFDKLYEYDIHGGIGWEPTVNSF